MWQQTDKAPKWRAESSQLKQEVERRENKLGMAKGLEASKPPLSGALPLAKLHPLSSPKSTTIGEPDVQIFECVWDSLSFKPPVRLRPFLTKKAQILL